MLLYNVRNNVRTVVAFIKYVYAYLYEQLCRHYCAVLLSLMGNYIVYIFKNCQAVMNETNFKQVLFALSKIPNICYIMLEF